jgi:hypothetical protein
MRKLLFVLFAFSSSAHAATISESCMLHEVKNVSPLKEDLNYTRGSGRGVDASFTKENTSARLGNISFSTSEGDSISWQVRSDGTKVYSLTKTGTSVGFQMTIYSPWVSGCSSGVYGCSSSASGNARSAVLTYTSPSAPVPVRLATFSCL